MPALAAALLTVVLWASAFVGIRTAGEDLSAGSLALARLLIASAALGLVVLARREPLPHVDAGTAAMLVNVGPILSRAARGADAR